MQEKFEKYAREVKEKEGIVIYESALHRIQLLGIFLAFVEKNPLLCIEIGEKTESKWLDPVCDKIDTTLL